VLAGATVAVAPVRCGSGIPLKVLDAWSVGVPVVASPFAVEGADGVPERDLLAAEGVDAWTSQVRRLLRDPALRARLVAGGQERIAALGPERVRGELLRQVAGAAAGREPPLGRAPRDGPSAQGP
jgi:glycosyltransferase involved in cell wall biosynthesis